MRGSRHGNFHFYSNGFIQLKRRGRLLLLVHGLETLNFFAFRRSLYEKKPRDYYWQESNDAIQKVIDDKLAEYWSAIRARRDQSTPGE